MAHFCLLVQVAPFPQYGCAVLEENGLIYRVNWQCNTLGDRLINDNDTPLPPALAEAPGILVDGNDTSPPVERGGLS